MGAVVLMMLLVLRMCRCCRRVGLMDCPLGSHMDDRLGRCVGIAHCPPTLLRYRTSLAGQATFTIQRDRTVAKSCGSKPRINKGGTGSATGRSCWRLHISRPFRGMPDRYRPHPRSMEDSRHALRRTACA